MPPFESTAPTAKPASSNENVYASAVSQVPDAIGDFAKEAYSHPLQMAANLGTEAAFSAGAGFALASFMPARGPAAWVIGAAFTAPLVFKGVEGLVKAHEEASKPGADVHAIGRKLADGAVSGGVNLGVTFAGGWAGGELGYKAGASDTAFGQFSRATRTKISGYENVGMVGLKGAVDSFKTSDLAAQGSSLVGRFSPRSATPAGTDAVQTAAPLTNAKPLSVLKGMSLTARATTEYNARLGHLAQSSDDFSGLTEYKGLIHGHTALSDGDATPQSFIDRSKAAGYDFILPSEHDHILARNGVAPTDERAGPEKDIPIVGSNPQELQTARDTAAAASVPGKFFADWGEELGTIGHIPPALDAAGKQIPKGANHTGIYGDEVYVRSDEPAQSGGGGVVGNAVRSFKAAIGIKPAADAPITINDIPDGRFDQVAAYIDAHPNPNGNPISAILNHPRVSQDFSPSVAANLQGHDYGVSTFPSFQDWLTGWGDKYVRGIEIMKGGALTEKPIAVIPPNFYDTQDAQIMWDKGWHGGVSAGPDIHFQERIGQPPLGTTILAKSLDAPGVYEALDARRMAVTSNFEKLTAHMTANNGKFMMGNILDQSTLAGQPLTPEVHIGGSVTPDANYTVNIWSDPKTGDGQLSSIVQTKTLTGAELQQANNVVTMDPIQHQDGNHSLFYAEVQRTDGSSPSFGDVMGTTQRNADGSPANVTITPHGTFVQGLKEEYEGPGDVHEVIDYAQTPITNPEVTNALNQPPSTPYPERAITSPIFVDPISGVGATHSFLLRGLPGAALQTPIPLDQQR